MQLRILFAACVALLAPSAALGANHQTYQTRPIQLGTSGGNVNDISHAFCCSGTLGSLVTNGSTQYILSNNHVLARVNQAATGEAVSQPGLVDLSCSVPPADYVANLTRFVPIDFSRGATNTVDCAIAQVIAGDVDPNGTILDIGTISSIVATATVGLAVEKSGRTTAVTTGSVTGVNATVSVQYQLGCGSGRKATATFVNQVVFTNISGGGDSGSLILTNSSCHQPVALLFAGSSSTTIGNPAGAVLSALGGLNFVGGQCANAAPSFQPDPANDVALRHAIEVQNRNTARLMQIQGVVGTAIGKDETGRYVVQVFLENDAPGLRGQIPAFTEDLNTRPIVTGTIEAY